MSTRISPVTVTGAELTLSSENDIPQLSVHVVNEQGGHDTIHISLNPTKKVENERDEFYGKTLAEAGLSRICRELDCDVNAVKASLDANDNQLPELVGRKAEVHARSRMSGFNSLREDLWIYFSKDPRSSGGAKTASKEAVASIFA